MNQSMESILQYFDEKELKYYVLQHPNKAGQELIRIRFRGKNINSIRLHLIVNSKGTNLAVRIWSIAKIPDLEKQSAFYPLLNEQNLDYRWYRFVLDQDNEISAFADAVITPDTAGAIAHELVIRGVQIVEDVYPFFMKAIGED